MSKQKIHFPDHGIQTNEILDLLREKKTQDFDWASGKIMAYVYYPGDFYDKLIQESHNLFFYENALNPSLFPSIRRIENEVIAMTADLLNGDSNVVGSVTSGGSESIFLVVKTALERARRKNNEIINPEIVIPVTAHPAFHKAAYYMNIKVKVVDVGEDKRVTIKNLESAITKDTIMLVGSAPNFPYGVIDPIEEIGKLALDNNLLFHVDACLGGFMLPFLEKSGYKIPPFDFRVPGVTSISADFHKFGYAPKGSSAILYKDPELRIHQFFVTTNWPGGIYASSTLLGSKSAGSVVAAWAIIKALGISGYKDIAQKVMETARKMQEGIKEIEDLELISNPEMSVFAFTAKSGDILFIGDEMTNRGWHLDMLQRPNALHVIVSQLNIGKEEEFLNDLRESVKALKKFSIRRFSSKAAIKAAGGLSKITSPESFRKMASKSAYRMNEQKPDAGSQKAVMYGIAELFDNEGDLRKLILEMMDKMYNL